eukprot:COSAG01_NODE_5325_length_4333_cov_27.694851_4_plen_127_part_00
MLSLTDSSHAVCLHVGGKRSDFEGGVRAAAFLAGGVLPQDVRGTQHHGLIAIADWFATLCRLADVDPTDDVPGVPGIDSIDVWDSILTPWANATNRSEVPISYGLNGPWGTQSRKHAPRSTWLFPS